MPRILGVPRQRILGVPRQTNPRLDALEGGVKAEARPLGGRAFGITGTRAEPQRLRRDTAGAMAAPTPALREPR